MESVIRFLVGGALVSLFAAIGGVLKPKGFAGLFAAAPSVALATLILTIAKGDKWEAIDEARTMTAGAMAFVLYAACCVYLMNVRKIGATPAALGALIPWGAAAFTFLVFFK